MHGATLKINSSNVPVYYELHSAGHKHHLAIFVAFTTPLLKAYTIFRLSVTLSVRLGVLSV